MTTDSTSAEGPLWLFLFFVYAPQPSATPDPQLYQDMLEAVRYENRMADLYEKQQAEARARAAEKQRITSILKESGVSEEIISKL